MLVNGLDANGFSSENWVRGGHQSLFETNIMTSPAFAARINNSSIKNLELGASFYTGKTAANTSKPEKMDHLEGRVTIGTFDAIYKNDHFQARANVLYGDLGESLDISAINRGISKNIQFPRTPVAKNAFTYSFEMGYNVLKFFNTNEKLYPFVRYEYYNSMHQTEEGMHADTRFDRDLFTAGINYFMLPNLALKVDYSHRKIDGNNYNSENTFGVALVYAGWFVNK